MKKLAKKESPIQGVIDPLKLAKLCWPHVSFYKDQREMLYSIRDNRETFVGAGNKLGKDFTTGYAVLWFFLSRSPCKILTTSVDSSQLQKVLWGEINTFIQNSKYPLPLRVIHQEIFRRVPDKRNRRKHVDEPNSYLIGRVAQAEEGMLGHHLPWGPNGEPHTLMAGDEASGIGTGLWDKTRTWRHRALAIGNCYPCVNFFYSAIKGGDVPSPLGEGLFRKVLKIRAEDSPNVRLAKKEITEGKKPSKKVLIPGVVTYEDYLLARATYDEMNQCISLDAEFYEGDSVYLFPPKNLVLAEEWATAITHHRYAKAIGCDPAEGGDSTTWAIIDESGLIKMITEKTPDTSEITSKTIALMNEYGVPADKVMFDRGGGGKQHADRLRAQGYEVHTVAFGEPVNPEKKRGLVPMEQRKMSDETRYVYKSRRVQMFHILAMAVAVDFALPDSELNKSSTGRKSLAEQLKVFPLLYDDEGRLKLPPKNKKPGSKEITLVDMIGHSPDEADALAIAYYCMTKKPAQAMVGAF